MAAKRKQPRSHRAVPKKDTKNHINPDHYKEHGDMEPVKIIEHFFEDDAHLSMATKYLLRNGGKDGESQERDLKKTLWWIKRKLQRLGVDPDSE